jgi:hypothetical protein
MEVTVTTIQFKVKNKPGKVNAADYRHLPRHPTQSTSVTSKHSMYSLGLTPGTVCMTYKFFQQVYRFLGNTPFHVIAVLSLLTFSKLRYELTLVPVNDSEILLHDKRIVIPKDLQMRVIDLAHEGHQGIVKTKQLLREKVYFPGIDRTSINS